MQLPLSRISSFMATVSLAAAVTALVGWPSRVNADGKAKAAARQSSQLATSEGAPQNAQLAKNEAKVGDLVISAELAESDASRGKRIVHLECRNPTTEKISGKLEIDLTRTNGVAAERVMPRPQIAWRHPEVVQIEPGETLTRDIPLPKNIGAEVTRIDKARERAEATGTGPYPSVYYGVYAMPLERAQATARSRSNSMMKASLPLASNSDLFGY